MLQNQQPRQASPIVTVNPAPQVGVYLRRTDKTGARLQMDRHTSVSRLMDLVRRHFHIPTPEQVIFIAGVQYDCGTDCELTLGNNTIVHVHHTAQLGAADLVVYLQRVGPGSALDKPVRCSTKSATRLADFVTDVLSESNVLLVESGRKLDLDKSFAQLSVPNGATILYQAIHTKIDHEEIENDLNMLFEDDEDQTELQPVSPSTLSPNSLTQAQQISRQTLEQVKTRSRYLSQNLASSQSLQLTPNFKKKSIICLKAAEGSPTSGETIWRKDETETSTRLRNQSLACVLKGRKTRNEFDEAEAEAERRETSPKSFRMSLGAKAMLKQQFQKLFTYQYLGPKPQQAQNDDESGLKIIVTEPSQNIKSNAFSQMLDKQKAF